MVTRRTLELFLLPQCVPPSLTHVVHDGGLSSLPVEVDHGIDAGGDVPGGRALSHAVHKEVEAAIFFPHHTDCVTRLQEGKKKAERKS